MAPLPDREDQACQCRSKEEYIMLVRWDPFEEMSRLSDQLFGARASSTKSPLRVAVDIREEPDAFYVDAEVPGVAAEDVRVEVEKNVLTISGERKTENEESEATYRRVERYYGSFSRSFTLPETVDAEQIHADLKNGVLTLRLPKKEAPKPRAIQVKAA